MNYNLNYFKNKKDVILWEIICISILFLVSPIPVSAKYDGYDAATYAKKYATERNKKYKSFSSNCTNFVSQCAVAGGLKMSCPKKISYNNNVYRCSKYWYMKKNKKGNYSWSSTWSLVTQKSAISGDGFYNYMVNVKKAKHKKYRVDTVKKLDNFIKACYVGDVIQLKDSSSKAKHHSCIVVEKSYDKKNKRFNMKICYNSNDTPATDFRGKLWSKFGKDVTWTLISLTSL